MGCDVQGYKDEARQGQRPQRAWHDRRAKHAEKPERYREQDDEEGHLVGEQQPTAVRLDKCTLVLAQYELAVLDLYPRATQWSLKWRQVYDCLQECLA